MKVSLNGKPAVSQGSLWGREREEDEQKGKKDGGKKKEKRKKKDKFHSVYRVELHGN